MATRNRHSPRPGLVLGALASCLVLASCSARHPLEGGFGEQGDGPPEQGIDLASIPDAVPRAEPPSPYGNPPSYVVNGKRYHVMDSSAGYVERGIASWYGTKFHGRRTSSGEPYDMFAMTAAHRRLPLPTYARVTNLRTGHSIVVKINDRGPFHENRLIDLSYAAAAKLGITGAGTGLVEVRALEPGRPESETASQQASNSPAGTADLYVQVGAFASKQNAEQLRDRLRRIFSRRVRIQSIPKGSGVLYRVQVGPIPSVSEADDFSLALAGLGVPEVHVVVE